MYMHVRTYVHVHVHVHGSFSLTIRMFLLRHEAQHSLGILKCLTLTRGTGILTIVGQLLSLSQVTDCVTVWDVGEGEGRVKGHVVLSW